MTVKESRAAKLAEAGPCIQGFTVALVSRDEAKTPDWVRMQLESFGIRFIHELCYEPAAVVDVANQADVVWLFGGLEVLTEDCLKSLPRCRAILRTGSGTDSIPVAAATELGIVVANTPEALGHIVAEHTIGLLLSVLRQIPQHDRAMRSGVWDPAHSWPNWHLDGSTLGFVGYGYIAKLVKQKMSGFGLNFMAYDPYASSDDFALENVRQATLDEVLRESDFISIHCPLTDETQNLIAEREFGLMKDNAVLINAARGPIVNEEALLRALKYRSIGGAALDVFEQEPPRMDGELIHMNNIVVAPHNGGSSDLYPQTFWQDSVDTLVAMSRGKMPLWYVNKPVKPRVRFS